jgi:hypothetical protein
MSTTTILLKRKTRDELKVMGSKGQTYDQLIRELIKLKKAVTSVPNPVNE